MNAEGFDLRIDGAKLRGQYVGNLGSHTAVTFLHAGVADSRMFAEHIGSLPPSVCAASYDRRGFGKTFAEDLAFSHVDDLHEVIRFLNAKSNVLVGCSQGARIALDYALMVPQAVAGLVLVSATYSGALAPTLTSEEMSLVEKIDAAEMMNDVNTVNELEAQLWLEGPQCSTHRVSAGLRRLFLDMNGIALTHAELTKEQEPKTVINRLEEIECPVLLVEGSEDATFVLQRHDELANALTNVERIVVRNTAHLVPMEKPDMFNELVANFMRDQFVNKNIPVGLGAFSTKKS